MSNILSVRVLLRSNAQRNSTGPLGDSISQEQRLNGSIALEESDFVRPLHDIDFVVDAYDSLARSFDPETVDCNEGVM